MSLVAYESSDESSNDGVEPESISYTKNNKITNETVNTTSDTKTDCPSNLKNHLNLPTPTNKPDEKSEVNNDRIVENKLFATLPKPKSFCNIERDIPEDDNLSLFKSNRPVVEEPQKKKRIPARISIPSLSDFKDIDKDLEESKKKPVSKKESGLFSILPPPKNEIVTKTNSLIPRSLTIPSNINLVPQKVHTTKVPTICAKKPPPIHETTKKTTKMLPVMDYDSNSDDDDDEQHQDFFSLNKKEILPEIHDVSSNADLGASLSKPWSKDPIANIDETKKEEIATHPEKADQEQSSTLISTVMNLPRKEILLKNKAEVGPKLPVPEQEFNVDNEGNVAFDDKAIEYLCGKRGVKRKNTMIEEANIIEINGEDIKPDEREWLVKAMTEEPVQRPVSMQAAGPSSQSKKKHQITYLAHQAKAMEIELKNTWTQNRMTRKQTQSKYGF